MKTLTDNRAEYFKQIGELHPYKIATYSPITNKELLNTPLQVLINTKAYEKQEHPPNWQMKTNNKIHAKIAIGTNGVYIGSWNFSNNSTQNMHEIGIIIERKENQQTCSEVEKYFDKLWTRT